MRKLEQLADRIPTWAYIVALSVEAYLFIVGSLDRLPQVP